MCVCVFFFQLCLPVFSLGFFSFCLYQTSRIIVDLKSGKIVKWWDGSFGKVLKGPWASNEKNPYKGLVEEINECGRLRKAR